MGRPEHKDRHENGEMFEKYLRITEEIVEEVGVRNLSCLIEETERFTLPVPEHYWFGKTYENSGFLKASLIDLNCQMFACGTPEGESISGLGTWWPDQTGQLELLLPRFFTGVAAKNNLQFLGFQMSYLLKEVLGELRQEETMIIDFYREGPWTEVQQHLWYLSGGQVEIPTEKAMISHAPADNFLKRTAVLANGEKLFKFERPEDVKTLILSDSVASGAQIAVALDYLLNIRGCQPERVVLVAPMITLFGAVCLSELLSDKEIDLKIFTGASLLDINYNREPEPGSLYYSPYPANKTQLANPEFLEVFKDYHPRCNSKPGIRCNWTESFLLSSRALVDSQTELKYRGLDHESLKQTMGQITDDLVADMGLDWKKLYSYAAKIF